MFITLVVAVVPSVVLLTYFYWRDRFEREPLHHVAAAYGLGAFAMVAAQGLATAAAGAVNGVCGPWLDGGTESARLFDALILSGFIEELSKLVVLGAAVYHWDEFDEPLDGLVYGVAVGLGFATVENFLYLQRWGLEIAWQRALFAVPAHALFGGTMGSYLGRAKFSRGSAHVRAWLSGLLLPMVFHGAYNFALAHRLDWRVWSVVVLWSFALWLFVLRRVYRAQRASPYRPQTLAPFIPSRPPAEKR